MSRPSESGEPRTPDFESLRRRNAVLATVSTRVIALVSTKLLAIEHARDFALYRPGRRLLEFGPFEPDSPRRRCSLSQRISFLDIRYDIERGGPSHSRQSCACTRPACLVHSREHTAQLIPLFYRLNYSARSLTSLLEENWDDDFEFGQQSSTNSPAQSTSNPLFDDGSSAFGSISGATGSRLRPRWSVHSQEEESWDDDEPTMNVTTNAGNIATVPPSVCSNFPSSYAFSN